MRLRPFRLAPARHNGGMVRQRRATHVIMNVMAFSTPQLGGLGWDPPNGLIHPITVKRAADDQ